MNEKEKVFEEFNNSLHRLGRITTILSIVLLVAVPFIVGIIYDASVNMQGFLSGLGKVAIVYYPVALVEFLIYTPMLGAAGSYITFITGNVTNMKIPCVINARDIAKTEVGTPENEVITAISSSTSAIVTMLVVAAGVLLIIPLQPILEHPTFSPAFTYVVAALFGALGLKYFSKSLKMAVVPLAVMTLLCIFVPSMIDQTSTLIVPSGALALGIGFWLFKKGKL